MRPNLLLSSVTAFAFLLGGCGAKTTTSSSPAVPAASPANVAPGARPAPLPPTLRLPTTVAPTGYEVELMIDPAKTEFSGRVVIGLQIAQPSDVVWLHARELTIDGATLGGRPLEVLQTPGSDFLGLRAAAHLPPGRAEVELRYRGKINRGSSAGIFAQKIADDWYVFTQFEPLGARRAFPCFDEPSFKVPWRLTIDAPEGTVIASNTHFEKQGVTGKGRQTARFKRTPPLPSYLVAFTVGPFEIVPAARSRHGTEVRVFTPRGHQEEAAYAAEVTPEILSRLEDYFGMPYPFEKLDSIPIPETFGFGAMENPGLVTYREDLLLSKPEELTIGQRRAYAGTCAHELAHQWFGNLVTHAWWDDLWLNEALSSWLPNKILDAWKPEWNLRTGDVVKVAGAMAGDSLDSARRVREPIADDNDIENAFDGITYGKGSAVLRMIERWIGEDTFQKGIRHYVTKRAGGVATFADFVADVGEAAGRDLAAPLASFFEQTGVPLVGFRLRCQAGGPGAPRLELTQRRYLPIGSKATPERTWQVPVCVKWEAGGKPGKACTLLTGAGGELELAGAAGCPDWVLPNADGVGYYRSALSEDLARRLYDRKVLARLGVGERLAVRNDVSALAASGDAELDRVLEVAVILAGDTDRHARQAAIGELWAIHDMVPEAQWPSYRKAVRKLFGPAARRIGFAPKKGEPEDTALLRPSLLSLVGDVGGDPAVLAEARRLAWKWLDDHRAVAPELVDTVLALAASRGDAKLYDRVLAEARKATDLQDRARLLGMLGGFRDPALVARSLQLVLGDELPPTETLKLMWAASRRKETRDLAWELVTRHYDALVARMPKETVARLVTVGSHYCSEEKRAEVAGFFAERSKQALGGPRRYRNALESLSLCAAYRARHAPSVARFLEQYQ